VASTALLLNNKVPQPDTVGIQVAEVHQPPPYFGHVSFHVSIASKSDCCYLCDNNQVPDLISKAVAIKASIPYQGDEVAADLTPNKSM
jgi:hypothetical protein